MSPVRLPHSRSGYLYVAVLMTALIISMMGLVALSSATLRTSTSADHNNQVQAELLAQSAIEDCLQKLASNSSWRSTWTHDTETTPVVLGTGTFSWKLIDDDGDLADDDSDSVRVIGIGRVGRIVSAESVRLIASGLGLDCLQHPLVCNAVIKTSPFCSIYTDQTVFSNDDVMANAAFSSIQGNAAAVGKISGNVSGTITEFAPAKRMPGSSALDYYLDNGTYISAADISAAVGSLLITKQLITPAINPFGSTNAEGIYVIDCQNTMIKIRDCRIVGTLVILNPGNNSALSGSLCWESAVANYPALIVAGDIKMQFNAVPLNETTSGVNFNPDGSPYRGNQDSDLLDVYPSEILGLVYVTGELKAADLFESRFRGVTLCTEIDVGSPLRMNYRPIINDYPPPGFAHGDPMVISPGSFRRETLD